MTKFCLRGTSLPPPPQQAQAKNWHSAEGKWIQAGLELAGWLYKGGALQGHRASAPSRRHESDHACHHFGARWSERIPPPSPKVSSLLLILGDHSVAWMFLFMCPVSVRCSHHFCLGDQTPLPLVHVVLGGWFLLPHARAGHMVGS